MSYRYVFTGNKLECFRSYAYRAPVAEFERVRRIGWDEFGETLPHRDIIIHDRQGASAQECAEIGTMLYRFGATERAYAEIRRGRDLERKSKLAHSFVVIANDYMPFGVARRLVDLRHFRRECLPAGKLFPDHRNDADPERVLRVGYLSGDFYRHSAFNSWFPILREHDRKKIHVTGYYTQAVNDDYTLSVKTVCDEFRAVAHLPDADLAEAIRADAIDVLVDLSGHTAGNRLEMLALEPAPVQLTAFGFLEGNGLRRGLTCHWGDAIMLTPADAAAIARPIAWLPSAFYYEPPADAPEPGDCPAWWGEPFTFGCFNKIDKITDEALATWKKILDAVPGSRLLLKDRWYDDEPVRLALGVRLNRLGFAARQVILAGGSVHRAHLEFFDEVDVALDPFPHGGGTSTAEALWMGVPVVTLYGKAAPGRVGAAMLYRAGLRGMIAGNLEQYRAIAVELSRDRAGLQHLRRSIRARLLGSLMFNARLFVSGVEDAYRKIWRAWCARKQHEDSEEMAL